MPYPYSAQLFISITSCELCTFTEKNNIWAAKEENYVFQLLSGKCNLIYKEKSASVQVRTVIFIARNTSCILECETACQGILLRFAPVFSPIAIDLNHLCILSTTINIFFTRKKKVCLLADQESINVSLSSILYEWEHHQPEREYMLQLLLSGLLLRIARSYNAHRQPKGVQLLAQSREYILQNFQRPLTIDDIAEAVGISRSYLSLLFRKYLSRTIIEYLQVVRCDHAAFLLSTTHFPIIDIALETGFNNRQHFARTFSKIYNMSPNMFRKTHSLDGSSPKPMEAELYDDIEMPEE